MGENPGLRFIEFVIATTIGSIVGAYIARDIEFSLDLLVRAVFAVAILAVFFFLVHRVAITWGKRKKKPPKQEAPIEEETPEEYPGEEPPEEESFPPETPGK